MGNGAVLKKKEGLTGILYFSTLSLCLIAAMEPHGTLELLSDGKTA